MLYLRTGQTIGKKLMQVKVVSFTDGTVPGFGGLIGLREIVAEAHRSDPADRVRLLHRGCLLYFPDRPALHP